jgi:hypothetical protein
MPVGEQPVQLPARKRPAADLSQHAERQLVSDFIRQHTSAPAVHRLNPVQVLPMRERSAHLHIAKLHALDVVAMFDVPLHPHRTDLCAQAYARAVTNPARMRKHFEFLPRRRKPCKRTGPLMPGKHLRGWSLDADTARKRG